MHIELSRNDAEALRDLLQARITELDKEINRTDNFAFKRSLQELDRTFEHVLGEISHALETADRSSEASSSRSENLVGVERFPRKGDEE